MNVDILNRLNSKTIKSESGCWLWQGSIGGGNYGYIRFDGIGELVHRISAFLFLGYDLGNQARQVNHQTFCPNKHCWNPEHLYVGTQKSNIGDISVRKPRSKLPPKTHCKFGHEYTMENIIVNRDKSKNCRLCQAERNRKYRKRLKLGRKSV